MKKISERNRWVEIYNQNHAVWEDKDNQLTRLEQRLSQIKDNRLSFLKAGVELLYHTDNPTLVLENVYNNVIPGSPYDNETIYYEKIGANSYKRYESPSHLEPSSLSEGTDLYNEMINDWRDKVLAGDLYTTNDNNTDNNIVLFQTLSPANFNYYNILLEDNDDPQRIYNIEISLLNPKARGSLITTLLQDQAAISTYGIQDQETVNTYIQVYEDFINFVRDYNKLTFLEAIGIANYTNNDIETLKAKAQSNQLYTNIILKMLYEIEHADDPYDAEHSYHGFQDFDWTRGATFDASTIDAEYLGEIKAIVQVITGAIEVNLRTIKTYIVEDLDVEIANLTTSITNLENTNAQILETINEAAKNQYDLVTVGSIYNDKREYFTKNGNNYTAYTTYNSSTWTDGINNKTLYVKNDRTTYGYKYVKVGSNITFDDTYYTNDPQYSPAANNTTTDVVFGKSNTADNQASGTFRITINKHVYEVPIKGFTDVPSNKPIYITANSAAANNGGTINIKARLADGESLGYIDLDGQVLIKNGHLNITGTDGSTGNGYGLSVGNSDTSRDALIYGSTYSTQYVGLYGYSDENTQPASEEGNNYGYTTKAGLWYDNYNNHKLIRTWNISNNDDDVGIGAYQYAFTGKVNGTDYVLGGLNFNTNAIEFHTGLPSAADPNNSPSWATIKTGNILPGIAATTIENVLVGQDLGGINNEWANIYAVNAGTSNNPITNGYFTNLNVTNLKIGNTDITSYIPHSSGTEAQFWRGGATPTWANLLKDDGGAHFILQNSSTAYSKGTTVTSAVPLGAIYFNSNDSTTGSEQKSLTSIHTEISSSNNTILYLKAMENTPNSTTKAELQIRCRKGYTDTGSYTNYNKQLDFNGVFSATKVFNAVFNDYAEYRQTINLEAGRVVVDNDDGSLKRASQRLQSGAQVISDTFGQAMGETDECKTPLAVAGRVLVYTYQNRENYHAGMAVCSAPNGTVDIMTREEIKEYPDCIIGIVSEIPQYKTWGTENVKVNGRIWIKVK